MASAYWLHQARNNAFFARQMCAMCGLSNHPLEDKRHMFCKHDFSLLQPPTVVSPLKSFHFMQACLSVRLYATSNHILARKCILPLFACYALRHKTTSTNVGCCLSNFEDLGEECE